jgi:ornithine carbamoyltransferase
VTDLLAIRDLDEQQLRRILDRGQAEPDSRVLEGKGVALYFEKPSARTRNSMEMAVVQLGGHPVYIQKDELGLGKRESAQDVARTLACYHSIIAARVFDHELLGAMAASVETPLLNMLSNSDHPLQALADLMTIEQLAGKLEGTKVAFIGDSNNVARSLAEGCALTGAEFVIASPPGYGFEDPPAGIRQVGQAREAVEGAHIVYTDVWVSMGQSAEQDARARAFEPFRVDEALMERSDSAWFMHCLPARRGEEVTAGVIDGPRSAVWKQAENRMHSARGALQWMLEKE